MKILRTSDHRFEGLPDFAFEPHYAEVDDTEGGKLRIHYVDEGSHPSEMILCLHGEPTWSFLYRKMIKVFVENGLRVIAPDLAGFGRSDKPTELHDFSYKRHVDWMQSFIGQLDLRNVTLFCQDWGGLIGLRLVAEEPQRFRRVVTANTYLPTGEEKPNAAFLDWRARSQSMPVFPVGTLINGLCYHRLSDAVIAAYDAPFPDESYKAGVRQFPLLVPISTQDPEHLANKRAWAALETFDRPWLTAFSDQDPMTKNGDRAFQRRVLGAKGQPHTTVANAGHFLQEDEGAQVAQVVVEFIKSS